MRILLNVIAIIFICGWVLGMFIFNDKVLVHILLVLGVFTLAINFLIIDEPIENRH
ncbi:hypothetical protein Pedsa_2181 [Pseudopedobacter saltans DSM 12145]|uniref:Lmo0937 family membrane protein n=1 Tax=Pseudopedobacter saltans (strain ATCC 51119 / DSM 12145 / JCM 21818 / CCUG 39354 / LMG 10337 / NBRC 100064 / NCIMB 13643) TaxID=762903 RepID=F0SBP2_PSESL|nr:DUF5670 family protein [Pseudopedobacter saltans]ADY52733.1 hypothetical protein Pedsa_2181 [Pseudopedobacter saltans DSM 12145]